MSAGVDSSAQVNKKTASASAIAVHFFFLNFLLTHSRLCRQAMWNSRSRLNSVRTMSESSEGCGTAVETEMSEEFSLGGSLKRRRRREDSAYMSQRDSMSGGPLESSSPETEEEDQNGYVLPGDSPERGERMIPVLLWRLSSLSFDSGYPKIALQSGKYIA